MLAELVMNTTRTLGSTRRGCMVVLAKSSAGRGAHQAQRQAAADDCKRGGAPSKGAASRNTAVACGEGGSKGPLKGAVVQRVGHGSVQRPWQACGGVGEGARPAIAGQGAQPPIRTSTGKLGSSPAERRPTELLQRPSMVSTPCAASRLNSARGASPCDIISMQQPQPPRHASSRTCRVRK